MKLKFIYSFCIIIFFISCNNNPQKKIEDNPNHDIYAIDTMVRIEKSNIKLNVECKEDLTKRVITNNQSDWVDNGLFDSNDGYYSYNSHEFIIQFEDEHGKNRAIINLDLLSEMSIGNGLNDKIGSLKGLLLDKNISFLGITSKGILMFKVSTYIPRGEDGSEWTIGVYNEKLDNSPEYKGKIINDAPCLLMKYDSEIGDGIHYKNNQLYISQFIGNWILKDENDYKAIIINSKEVSYSENGNINLHLRYELVADDANKLLLFLNYGTGFDFGDFSAEVGEWSWKDFSREKPIAELIHDGADKNKMIMNWFGFYNQKTKSYEWGKGAGFKSNNLLIKS